MFTHRAYPESDLLKGRLRGHVQFSLLHWLRLIQQTVRVFRRIPTFLGLGWRSLLPAKSPPKFSFLDPVECRVAPIAPVLSWFRLHFLPPVRTPELWC